MALTITRIPEPYQAGFAKLKGLPAETVSSLIQVVEQLPPTSGIKEMVSAISTRLPSLNRDDVEAIIRTLYSLYVFRASSGADTTISELASNVISAMQASGKESLALSDNEKSEFREKLNRLLGSTVFETSSKVQQLKTDYPSIFYDAKILTDIRPLFSDPAEQPVAVILTNTLKIVYHGSGGEHKELYVALDSEDIQTLKRVVQRAEAKQASLKALLKDMKQRELS